MRNLKRALSLVMAAAMLIGMMVISASAVSSDFTDNDEIDHKEAVNVMVTLSVIDGKEDGSYYDPDGSLTRAEMAKIVAYVMNGGVEPVVGTKVVPTYSDIKGHWAEKYIEYCSSMGIIAGDGAGKFNPGGTLTGEQAAKMFLTAMGYNANVFGFVGNDWAINVGRYANEAGLYEDLGDITPSAVISRDDAAQMAYNAIQATMMRRTWQQDMTTGQLTEAYSLWTDEVSDGRGGTVNRPHTLLVDKFDGNVYEGILSATGEYDLSTAALLGDANGDSVQNSDGFVVTVDHVNSGTITPDEQYFEYKDQDLTDLMGQYVKVLYNSKTETVYGIYPVAGKNTTLTTTTSLVSYPSDQPNRVTVDGTNYNLETDIKYILSEAAGARTDTFNDANAGRISANKVVFVDNDGNGKFDVALVTPRNVAEISFISTTSVTLSLPSTNTTLVYQPKTLSPRLEDIIYDANMAKGDFVVVTRDYYTDNDKLAPIEKLSGSVSGVRGNPAPLYDYQIDGAWHKVVNGYSVSTTIKSGATIDYVAIDGVIFYAKLTAGAKGVEDVAVIYDLSYGAAGTFDANTLSAKIILADGGKKTVTVAKLYDNVDETTNYADGDGSIDNQEDAFKGQLVTYTVNNDGEYEFTLLHAAAGNMAANLAGYDSVNYAAAVTTNNDDNTIGGVTVADDAVIFLYAATASTVDVPVTGATIGSAAGGNADATAIKVITGKEFKDINNSDSMIETGNASALIGRDDDGFSRVRAAMVAVVAADGGATVAGTPSTIGYNTNAAVADWTLGTFAGSNYGYLVADSWRDTVDGTRYRVYSVWTGEGTEPVELMEESTSNVIIPARTVIAYDVVEGNTIKNVDATRYQQGAVHAYSASNNLVTLGTSAPNSGTEYSITNDTVVININDLEKKGVEGNAILTASSIGDPVISYVENCYYIFSGDEVQALVIDVSKNQVANPTLVFGGTPSASDLATAFASTNTVTVPSLAAGTVTIPAGKTLNVTGSVSAGTTFTGGGKIEVTGTVADTSQVATAAALSNNMTLPAPNVTLGVMGGNIGTGSELFGAANYTGKAFYQFTVPGYVAGNTTLKSVDGTSLNSTINSADDLIGTFASGQTRTIVITISGEDHTFTVTAPNF